MVVNPAVDKNRSEFVQHALSRQIPLTSEMNLFFERCRGRIIGVTGSLGKSTTTAMIFDTLRSRIEQLTSKPTRVWLGGNIGESLLKDLPDISPEDYVVLELSSFQLQDLRQVSRSCHLALLTNLWPQHLDRHGCIYRR